VTNLDETTFEWFQNIRENKHIFVYSVCGRSRSTFLQRLLNSSGDVLILGEHHYIIDDICRVIWAMLLVNKSLGIDDSTIDVPTYPWMTYVKKSHDNLCEALESNSHQNAWYPNAMTAMTLPLQSLLLTVALIFKPLLEDCPRFGLKEIRLSNIKTLHMLKWIFPNSLFVFVYRQPSEQWVSINNFLGKFEYSSSAKQFSKEYVRLSQAFREFHESHPDSSFFVSDKTLLDEASLKQIFEKIEINQFDGGLAKVKTGSSKLFESRYYLVRACRSRLNWLKSQYLKFLFWQTGAYSAYSAMLDLELKQIND
jgi:hypothetical protein